MEANCRKANKAGVYHFPKKQVNINILSKVLWSNQQTMDYK